MTSLFPVLSTTARSSWYQHQPPLSLNVTRFPTTASLPPGGMAVGAAHAAIHFPPVPAVPPPVPAVPPPVPAVPVARHVRRCPSSRRAHRCPSFPRCPRSATTGRAGCPRAAGAARRAGGAGRAGAARGSGGAGPDRAGRARRSGAARRSGVAARSAPARAGTAGSSRARPPAGGARSVTPRRRATRSEQQRAERHGRRDDLDHSTMGHGRAPKGQISRTVLIPGTGRRDHSMTPRSKDRPGSGQRASPQHGRDLLQANRARS